MTKLEKEAKLRGGKRKKKRGKKGWLILYIFIIILSIFSKLFNY